MPAKTSKLVSSPSWPEPEQPRRQATLQLDAPTADKDDQPVRDISAAALIGDDLFLGADEGAKLERLSPDGRGGWANHTQFDLKDYLDIDAKHSGEVDVEGLAYDDGWLWILGSHSRTRPKVGPDDDGCISVEELADLKDTRPRCLLARVPLVRSDDGHLVPAKVDGVRKAGKLDQTKHGNALSEALYDDPLIRPFTALPAKENGVDLEGIAVAGSRVAIGCRGPVVGTYALLLEVIIEAKSSGRLKMREPPVKRLVDLQGTGIRDCKRHGNDLLLLSGPVTNLDGPVALYRWRDWLHDGGSTDDKVRLHQPEVVMFLPFGQGNDHPEGLAIMRGDDGATEVLLLLDGPSEQRFQPEKRRILCDVFELPEPGETESDVD